MKNSQQPGVDVTRSVGQGTEEGFSGEDERKRLGEGCLKRRQLRCAYRKELAEEIFGRGGRSREEVWEMTGEAPTPLKHKLKSMPTCVVISHAHSVLQKSYVVVFRHHFEVTGVCNSMVQHSHP